MSKEMKLDDKLNELPLTKSNPSTLNALFGTTEVAPMWVADMEFQVAQPIQDALVKRVANSGFGYEYKPESFFLAQKEWYKSKYQIDLNRDHILFSPTISTTIAVLIENFSNENDGIVIQPPVFMEFRDTVRKTNRNIIKNPLKLIDHYYEIDFEDLNEKTQSPDCKILIICNPHNPVGRVWTRKELSEVVKICKANDIMLISDEIHKDIILFDNQFTSLLDFQGAYDKIVVCTSEAKSFNLCGIADSMAIIPNEKIRDSVSRTFKKYNLGRTNALTRVALEAAYKEGDLWLTDVLNTVEKNVNSIEAELKDSEIGFIKPEGTYQVWLDFRGVYRNTKEMFNQLTERSGVGMNAGHWFGREGALFMRMNIATTNNKVIDAIKKIQLLVLVAMLLGSCKTTIEVAELCSAHSYVDDKFVDGVEMLALAEHNDTSYNELDTIYFEVEKTTGNRYKLSGRSAYEEAAKNPAIDLERYTYLKGWNQTEKAWRTTAIPYRNPKRYTDERQKTICDEDLTASIAGTIQKKLIRRGYTLSREDNHSEFEGAFREALIQYQKDKDLPYGRIDLITLNSLGIRVRTEE